MAIAICRVSRLLPDPGGATSTDRLRFSSRPGTTQSRTGKLASSIGKALTRGNLPTGAPAGGGSLAFGCSGCSGGGLSDFGPELVGVPLAHGGDPLDPPCAGAPPLDVELFAFGQRRRLVLHRHGALVDLVGVMRARRPFALGRPDGTLPTPRQHGVPDLAGHELLAAVLARSERREVAILRRSWGRTPSRRRVVLARGGLAELADGVQQPLRGQRHLGLPRRPAVGPGVVAAALVQRRRQHGKTALAADVDADVGAERGDDKPRAAPGRPSAGRPRR